MSKAQDGVKEKKFSKHPQAKARRYSAMKRLEDQLERDYKITSDGENVALTDKDKKRITKELSTLKERI
jgi:hypothetical protein